MDTIRDATGGFAIVPNSLVYLPPPVGDAIHIAVYVTIRSFAHGAEQRSWPGVRRVAELLGVRRQTVSQVVRHLELLGFLQVTRVVTARGNHNEYTILREPTLEEALAAAREHGLLPAEGEGGGSSRGPRVSERPQGLEEDPGSSKGSTGGSSRGPRTIPTRTTKNPPLPPEGGGGAVDESTPPDSPRRRVSPDPRVQAILTRFDECYRNRFGRPPVLSWPKAGRQIKRLPEEYGTEQLLSAVERFFRSEDPWLRQTGYAWEAFMARLQGLLAEEEAAPTATPVVMPPAAVPEENLSEEALADMARRREMLLQRLLERQGEGDGGYL